MTDKAIYNQEKKLFGKQIKCYCIRKFFRDSRFVCNLPLIAENIRKLIYVLIK